MIHILDLVHVVNSESREIVLEELGKNREKPDCGRASSPINARTKVMLQACCRLPKLEGAMNKGVTALLLDCVFVAADYNELLFGLILAPRFYLVGLFNTISIQHYLVSLFQK